MSFFYILLSMRISEMSLQCVGLFSNSLMKSTRFLWWLWKLKPPSNIQSIPTESPQLHLPSKALFVCVSHPRALLTFQDEDVIRKGLRWDFNLRHLQNTIMVSKNGPASLSSETLVRSHALTSACYRAKLTTILAEINYSHWISQQLSWNLQES